MPSRYLRSRASRLVIAQEIDSTSYIADLLDWNFDAK